jgi:hypothetical protein
MPLEEEAKGEISASESTSRKINKRAIKSATREIKASHLNYLLVPHKSNCFICYKSKSKAIPVTGCGGQ